MKARALGDDPRLREILSELRDIITVAERTSWSRPQARAIVEALRSGVPPSEAAVALTVGREHLLGRISHDLDEIQYGKSCLVFLRGEYGMGKTHTLRVLQEYAHQHSFASALVELSSRECPLHDLGLLYRKVVRNLQIRPRCAGSAVPALLERWADQIRKVGKQDREQALTQLRQLPSDYRAALTSYFESQQGGQTRRSTLILEWMMGEKLSAQERHVIGVSANTTQSNALNMLSGLVSMLRITGIRGVAILLDETEPALSFAGSIERMKAVRNLNVLMRASGTFPYSYFVYSTLPQFFCCQDVLAGVDVNSRDILDLQVLEPPHLMNLACKIRDLHLLAYTWENQPRVRESEITDLVRCLLEDHSLGTSVRAFVRATVGVLDCCQQDARLTLKDVMRHLSVSTFLV